MNQAWKINAMISSAHFDRNIKPRYLMIILKCNIDRKIPVMIAINLLVGWNLGGNPDELQEWGTGPIERVKMLDDRWWVMKASRNKT